MGGPRERASGRLADCLGRSVLHTIPLPAAGDERILAPLAGAPVTAPRCTMRTLRDLQQELPISAENGLTLEAAARSRDKYGYNKLTPLPREPIWKKFLE